MKRCIVVLLAGLLFALFHSSAANAAAPTLPIESGTIAASEQDCYCNGTLPACILCGQGSQFGNTSCCILFLQFPGGPSRLATQEERQALFDAATTLLETMPPGLERDRAYARLLGEYGFLEDRINALKGIVELDRVNQLQDVIEVMNLYALIGRPEEGLRYAEEINSRLPATMFYLNEPIIVDFNAGTRVELWKNAAAVARANQLDAEAARLTQQADAVQAQIDSFNIVEVIVEALGIAQ